MAVGSYYLASGTITKATLLASASNNWENFPVQSDMAFESAGWVMPERKLTKRPTRMRFTISADGTAKTDGFYQMEWGWPYWSTGQMSYILTTFFGGPDVYGTVGALVTLQTYFDTTYVAFNATMYRPVWGDQYGSEDFGFNNVILRFKYGTLIT